MRSVHKVENDNTEKSALHLETFPPASLHRRCSYGSLTQGSLSCGITCTEKRPPMLHVLDIFQGGAEVGTRQHLKRSTSDPNGSEHLDVYGVKNEPVHL